VSQNTDKTEYSVSTFTEVGQCSRVAVVAFGSGENALLYDIAGQIHVVTTAPAAATTVQLLYIIFDIFV